MANTNLPSSMTKGQYLSQLRAAGVDITTEVRDDPEHGLLVSDSGFLKLTAFAKKIGKISSQRAESIELFIKNIDIGHTS